MRSLVVVCLLVGLLATSVGAKQHSSSWDFLLLVQQWGQSFCATQKDSCSVPSGTTWFTLHGLWPNNNDTTYPDDCGGPPFDEKEIASIEDVLNKYWTNYLTDDTPQSFWEHEFDKHGTCAVALPSLGDELKYFSGALTLRNSYDATQPLLRAGIVPSNNNTYVASQVNAAIKAAYGAEAVLGCVFSDDLQEDVLVEIGLCVDKHLTVFQCDPRVYAKGIERTCDSGFYWLVSSGYYDY